MTTASSSPGPKRENVRMGGWGGGEGFSINAMKCHCRGRTCLVRSHRITTSVISDAENTDKKLDFFPFQLACYFKY